MKSTKILKGACVAAVASMLPLSQAAMADVNISGWINEGMLFYDDGDSSDAVQSSDNGTTLGSRITFSGSTELANSGLTAGFEVILEPQSNNTPLIFSGQTASINTSFLTDGDANVGGAYSDTNGHNITVLGNSVNVGGAWGKVTVGLQSMPTDNIAVLADPSLTLWSGISPVFRGNGFTIMNNSAGTGTVWGDFLSCYAAPGLRGVGGIGIDCNGIYRNGVRYDLPAFGPVSVAVGYANDDVYDIAAKYNGQLGRLNAILHLGYAINQGVNSANYSEAENFQVQAGLMDPVTGLFGSIAYQNEDADLTTAGRTVGVSGLEDSTDAFWLKVGIKKQWLSIGDTSLSFDYGSYNDQFDGAAAALGVTGSEVERLGFSVDQYFGSNMIIYGKYEQLDLDADCGTAACSTTFSGSDELDTFTAGITYFF